MRRVEQGLVVPAKRDGETRAAKMLERRRRAGERGRRERKRKGEKTDERRKRERKREREEQKNSFERRGGERERRYGTAGWMGKERRGAGASRLASRPTGPWRGGRGRCDRSGKRPRLATATAHGTTDAAHRPSHRASRIAHRHAGPGGLDGRRARNEQTRAVRARQGRRGAAQARRIRGFRDARDARGALCALRKCLACRPAVAVQSGAADGPGPC